MSDTLKELNVNENTSESTMSQNDLDNEQPSDITEQYIEMYPGTPMELQETYSITSSKETRLIVIAGSVNSGKTALLASIYHLLLKSKLNEVLFSGSLTLKGFEERSTGIRIASGHSDPVILRTPISFSKYFLHLCLHNTNTDNSHDLLLSDISGEDYEAIIAHVDLAKTEYKFIKRADFFVLLVDGDKIASVKNRHAEKFNSYSLLGTLIDAQVLLEATQLFIVFNKLDILTKNINENTSLQTYIDTIKKEIITKYEIFFPVIKFFEIAALPSNTEDYKVGHNVDQLITDWVSEEKLVIDFNVTDIEENHSSFDFFGQKVYQDNYNE